MGGALNKLLMPQEESLTKNWLGFGPAEDKSLLLIGHVKLPVADLDTSKQFFVNVLGAEETSTPSGSNQDDVAYRAACGTSFVLTKAADDPVAAWPGQFYVWASNLQKMSEAAHALEKEKQTEVVLEELCLKMETKIDVLVLRDPSSNNIFVVNQAPKGYTRLLKMGGLEAKDQNLLAVMDVQCQVDAGQSAGISQFYRKALNASGKRAEDCCKVDFAFKDSTRQTLTFKEPEATTDAQTEAQGEATAEETQNQTKARALSICFYMPTEDSFKEALKTCKDLGLNISNEDDKEFVFRDAALAESSEFSPIVEHVIRSPLHGDCPVSVGAETK